LLYRLPRLMPRMRAAGLTDEFRPPYTTLAAAGGGQ
jgi:hypothetical protein